VLSPHEADLVRRDPALPGLAIVLDPEAFVAALRQSLPEANLGTAQITYVRYKPGMNCLVGYQLEVAGAVVELYAKAHGSDAAVKLQKARKRPSSPGPLGPGRVVLEADAIVVCSIPNDRKVKALPYLVDAEARKRLFHQLLPDRPDLWEGTVRRLAYKPERRYVAQVLADSQAVVRAYTKSGYQEVQRKVGALGSHQSLRIAPQIGRSDHRCILVFEWLPGLLLSEAIAAPELSLEAVAAVGAALTALHAQPGDRLTQLTRAAEAATLLEVASGLGHVCPPLLRQANDLAQRLAGQLAQAPLMNRSIHGDFYAKQVLLATDSVAILDLDEAVHGDPAADLGNFIAHLHRDALRGNMAPSLVEPVRDALLEGYRLATRGPLPDRIELYTAIGLLRLAHDPFRHCEPNWPERTEALLQRAAEILQMLPPRTCSAPYSPDLHPTEEGMKS
jgi:Phosphotransferase enzyme family